MKSATLLASILGLVAIQAAANPAPQPSTEIQSLSCAAANGVVIHSGAVTADRQAIAVTAQWGVMQKNFVAKILPSKEGNKNTVIGLFEQDANPSYLIDLQPAKSDSAPEAALEPEVGPPVGMPSGTFKTRFGVLKQSPTAGSLTTISLAAVACDLELVAPVR